MSPLATVIATVTFPVPWLVHPTDSAQNLPLPLTARALPLTYPQTITEWETLGGTRKGRAMGEVLGAEGELIITANHSDPRTYRLAEQLRARKVLNTTWLLKFPQKPGALMTSIPGQVLEVSLGVMREVPEPGKTTVILPFVEVGAGG